MPTEQSVRRRLRRARATSSFPTRSTTGSAGRRETGVITTVAGWDRHQGLLRRRWSGHQAPAERALRSRARPRGQPVLRRSAQSTGAAGRWPDGHDHDPGRRRAPKVFSGDGGPAGQGGPGRAERRRARPRERTLLFIADVADHRVRVVDLGSGNDRRPSPGPAQGPHDGDGGPASRRRDLRRTRRRGRTGRDCVHPGTEGNSLRAVDPQTRPHHDDRRHGCERILGRRRPGASTRPSMVPRNSRSTPRATSSSSTPRTMRSAGSMPGPG